MLMDNKGGSSAAISGGSGENTGFLNAPEKPMGAVENFEAAFNSEPTPSDETNEPVDDVPETEASEAHTDVTKLIPQSQEESSPVDQEVQEFEGLLKTDSKQNEDDISKKVAGKFNGDMKEYEDDPATKNSIYWGEGKGYRTAVFPQTWGEDGKGGAAA